MGIESLQQLGISIPKDVAMMSFDDHDVFRLFPPGITIIEQPVEEIAKTAINLLMAQLGKNKPIKKNKVQLPAKLVIRGLLNLKQGASEWLASGTLVFRLLEER
ncbi:substrate-binding domain-containing protein [Paraflavitalea speifideaquila]|uniref:substrate-binding domain-containing protein n=1 Tax=Paraflavitalea speifideaquila TaxID=3076558 RepID=UPI0028EC2CA7|nr:substrate-binding domain-containing protein [Paraflavitalea speifideiaquila]